MPRGESVDWTPEMDALLGTEPDRKVADQLGVGQQRVCRRRTELGIRSFHPLKWAPEDDALLGTMSDANVANELGFEVNPETVRLRRVELGIPSWHSKNRVVPEDLGSWTTEARRFYTARAYSKKLGLLDTLTLEQWEFACDWFDDCCAYCGRDAFLTEDHLVPASKGGPRTALNIIPACWECNYSKRAKQAHLWIYEKFGMEQGEQVVARIVAYLTDVKRREKL